MGECRGVPVARCPNTIPRAPCFFPVAKLVSGTQWGPGFVRSWTTSCKYSSIAAIRHTTSKEYSSIESAYDHNLSRLDRQGDL